MVSVVFVGPPSVLPDISPLKGENDSRWALAPTASFAIELEECSQPFSPLEGEMSGRTGGGATERFRCLR